MSLTYDGVWKSGVWATTVWTSGVWAENPVITLDLGTFPTSPKTITVSGISAAIARRWRAIMSIIRGVITNYEDT